VSLAFAVALTEMLEDGDDDNAIVLIKDNALSVLSFVQPYLSSVLRDILYMN